MLGYMHMHSSGTGVSKYGAPLRLRRQHSSGLLIRRQGQHVRLQHAIPPHGRAYLPAGAAQASAASAHSKGTSSHMAQVLCLVMPFPFVDRPVHRGMGTPRFMPSMPQVICQYIVYRRSLTRASALLSGFLHVTAV